MSFNQFNLDRIFVQSRNIFDTYIYRTEDSLADVESSGYFNSSRFAKSDPDSWKNGVIEVLCSDGFVKGSLDDNGNFQVIGSPVSDNWVCDAKPSGAAVNVTTGNTWQSAIINSTIPYPEMVNPNLVYQGNSRYLNDYGVPITVKGFCFANVYTASISTTTYQFTCGLWDGANIIPELSKLVTWTNIRGINQSSGNSGNVYSYELDVPAGGIWGFSGQRITTAGSDVMQFYGYHHTALRV